MASHPVQTKPVPVPTPATLPYWQGTHVGELRLQRCGACAGHVFYPRTHCPHCGAAALAWVRASGRGRLHSYVINHLAAPGWAGQMPIIVAVVALDEGPRLLANLVGVAPDPAQLELDMPLQVVFEARGEQVLPMFEPMKGLQ